MSSPVTPVAAAGPTSTVDPFDARVAVRADPFLGRYNRAGVLGAADVHVARRLGRLAGESDDTVLLAVALASRAVRSGSVCVRLDDLDVLALPEGEDVGDPALAAALPWPALGPWTAAVAASPLVAVGPDGPGDRPVRLVGGRLYLDRYWRHEEAVRHDVDARAAAGESDVDVDRLAAALDRLWPDAVLDARQREAASTTVRRRLTVLTGGPGTGKTTTVARVLALLHDLSPGPLKVALVAPTGKAAARLQEAVREQVGRLDPQDEQRVTRAGEPEATTVHRLLGWRPGSSTRFRHDAAHHLPHDVVVVDETSMVSLPLMARLLEALRPQARLLLVGDPDQLASVEAGAVLGDLVARRTMRGAVVRLDHVHRHGGRIVDLARAIREGDADAVLSVLRDGDGAVQFVETSGERPVDEELDGLREDATAAGVALVAAARAGDGGAALAALERHRLLLAHRRGPAGVAYWAGQVEGWVARAAGLTAAEGVWYPGRPLLVTTNDRDSGLYNGDTGVVVDRDGEPVAVFGDPASPRSVRPHRLPAVETVHAMTVHRGQGSQFERVTLVLPVATSPLLTRELLYTAVTRARDGVRVVGTAAAVRRAVDHPVRRASGLRED